MEREIDRWRERDRENSNKYGKKRNTDRNRVIQRQREKNYK